MGALDGIRVVELAGGVGAAYAAKLLADLGADVLRVETGRDLVRRRPHQAHRWLNTSKRSVSELGHLLDGADLLIHDLGPAAAAGAGVAWPDLAARHPGLVVGSVTPYGMTGPWADWAGTELSIMHASSWGFLSPGSALDPELPPLKAPGHHATILTATVAAAAFLAAVDRAAQTGQGEHVDFSAFAASAKLTETAPAGATFQGEDASRLGVKTVVPWAIYPCRDGLVQLVCVEEAQWVSLLKLMDNPEWGQMEIFATNADRRENSDLVHLYLSEWVADQSLQDLYRRGQELRLCVSPVYTMDQLDADAQFQARGFFHCTPDGLTLPGPGFQFDWPAWDLRRSAPEPGQHDGESWEERPAPAAAPGTASSTAVPATGGRPLDGVRICDFTWIWAGPYCNQLLAHLGAEVVRLESPDYLCLFRRLPFNPPELPLTPDSDGLFQLYNSDKRSLGIDLRHEEAKEVVRRLVAQSDVVIENFAVGALASLGFGVDELRAINPDVIVVSLSGYGQTGPSASYMAYGPVGGAVAGLYAANGYQGGPPFETGVAIGDPGTGLTAAFATVAALVARRRTGRTSRLDVAMVEAIAATVGELWMQYQADGVAPRPAGNRDPQWAPHGVYATGDDEWITIACTDDDQWRALAGVATGQADSQEAGSEAAAAFADPRFATEAGRKEAEDELEALMAAWVAGQDRWELTHRLQAVGVPAVPSLAPLELWTTNEQLAATGMLEQPDHPVTGRRTVPGVPWRLANGANGLRRPAPLLGQHTDEVTAELGFSPDEVAALRASGALPT